MPNSLISQFDLIFVLLDTPNIETDKKISNNIIKVYYLIFKNHFNQDLNNADRTDSLSSTLRDQTNTVSQEFLKDFIEYARQMKEPKLTQEASESIKNYFHCLRSSNVKYFNN